MPAWAGAERRITCVAFCGNSGQEEWQFTLVLSPETASRDQIDWPALLPSDRLTGWLGPDPQNKTVRIDPYPDTTTSTTDHDLRLEYTKRGRFSWRAGVCLDASG